MRHNASLPDHGNLRLPRDARRVENELGAVAGVDLVPAAERLHALAGAPRLHGVARADLVVRRRRARLAALAAALARRVAARALVEVLDQRAERRDRRHDDAEVVLDRRPQDQRRAVRVVDQPLDRLDADDLDDGDEDAEAEQAQEHDLLAVLDVRAEEDGEGEGHADATTS